MKTQCANQPYFYRVRPPVSELFFNKKEFIKDQLVQNNTSLFFNSLRSGLFFFLFVAQKLLNKPQLKIGVQVFTCRSVLQAIRESGNIAFFHDISPEYFSSDPNFINYSNIDVLILTHPFGIPNPYYEEIADKCQKKEHPPF